MNHHNTPVLIGWIAVAVFSQLFLLGVSYTGASFYSAGTPIRDYLAPSQIISSHFDNELSVIADNLNWSVTTSAGIVGQQVVGFLGLQQAYAFDQSGSSAGRTTLASQAEMTPMVLGAYTYGSQ